METWKLGYRYSPDSRNTLDGFQSKLLYLLAVILGNLLITSLCLTSICKIGEVIVNSL